LTSIDFDLKQAGNMTKKIAKVNKIKIIKKLENNNMKKKKVQR